MSHKPYVREVAGGNSVVLFIHGILGTPDHFNDFIDKVPNEISVCNILLKGHGGEIEDFSKSSMKEWKECVVKTMGELSLKYKEVYIVAHSMGTLFAIQASLDHPVLVKKLFLLASPLKIFMKPSMVLISAKVIFEKVKETDEIGIAAKRSYSVKPNKHVMRYVKWIPRGIELFQEAKRVRKLVKNIKVDCEVFQSKKDEVVSNKSSNYFMNSQNINLHILENSRHNYYHKNDYEILLNSFDEFIKPLQV